MSVRTISSIELRDLLASTPDLPLVDVRMPGEFREVHVVGARNVPLDRLSAETLSDTLGQLDDGPVYFICKTGKRSEMACQKAPGFGVADVTSVEGGTDGCIADGLTVERGKKAVSLERQVRIVAGGLVLVGAVLALTVHPYWAALPAFVGAGLVFAGVTDTCAMGMLLMKMPWNR
ncbi:MAG: rhodanese-like domain-containing protein [Thermoguttaceae bacterium]